jgi:hypothetical protein
MALCADPILGLVTCDEIFIPGYTPGTPPPSPTPGGSYDASRMGKPGDPLYGLKSPCGPTDSVCQFRFWARSYWYNDCTKNSGRGGSNCNDRDTKNVICALERDNGLSSEYCGTLKSAAPAAPRPAPSLPGASRRIPYGTSTPRPGAVPSTAGRAPSGSPGLLPFTNATQAFVAPLPVAALATDIGGGFGLGSTAAGGILDLLAYAGTWLAGFVLPFFVPGKLSDDIPYTGIDPFPNQPSRKPITSDRPDTILPDVVGVPLPEPGIETITITAPRPRPVTNPLQFPLATPFVGLPTSSPYGRPTTGDPFSTPQNRPTTSPKPTSTSRPTSVPRPIGDPFFTPFVGDPLFSSPFRVPSTPKGKVRPITQDPLTLDQPYQLPSFDRPKPPIEVRVDSCPPCPKKKDKKKEPRKLRSVCYRGTYTEKSKGLVKSRGVQIPCQ